MPTEQMQGSASPIGPTVSKRPVQTQEPVAPIDPMTVMPQQCTQCGTTYEKYKERMVRELEENLEKNPLYADKMMFYLIQDALSASESLKVNEKLVFRKHGMRRPKIAKITKTKIGNKLVIDILRKHNS